MPQTGVSGLPSYDTPVTDRRPVPTQSLYAADLPGTTSEDSTTHTGASSYGTAVDQTASSGAR
jgi:hypothetical protein